MKPGRRRDATLIAIGAIVVTILACVSPSAAVAAFPGANGRIAYVSVEDELVDEHTFAPRGDIVTVLPDGSGRQELTDGPASEGGPSWSADGRRLVFSRAPGELGHQLFMMNADGSGQSQITEGPDSALSPSFAPHGRRVVFVKNRRSIWTIRTDGTDSRRLVGAGQRDGIASPQYSPNGRRIVFAGVPKNRSREGIWTMRRDGSGLRRLTKPTQDEIDGDPDHSPDGRHIAFVRGDASFGGFQPHLMRADGSRERPIPGTFLSTAPAYAPAGDRIALATETTRGFPFCANIFTISPSGSDRQVVTHNCDPQGQSFPSASSPSWQPLPGPE
jgi:TolB protein